MGVGIEVRPCPKSLDQEQVSTFACAARTGSPNTAKETGKVQVKQLKHTKMKNEGEDIRQTTLNASEVCNRYTKPIVPTMCKWFNIFTRLLRTNKKAQKVKVAAESWRFSHPIREARLVRRRHGGWDRNLKH